MNVNETKNEGKVFCSVCPDWEIQDLKAAPAIMVAGKKHYFCNDDCLKQFKDAQKK